jgi:hypothetical protein
MYSTDRPHVMDCLFIFKIKMIDSNSSKWLSYKYLVIDKNKIRFLTIF